MKHPAFAALAQTHACHGNEKSLLEKKKSERIFLLKLVIKGIINNKFGPDAQLQWDVQAPSSLVVLFNVTGNELQFLAIQKAFLLLLQTLPCSSVSPVDI